MTYTTKQINAEWKMKVNGIFNGEKVNKLVGVSGLIEIFGEEFADKFTCKAFKSLDDSITFKLRRGIKVTYYRW